MSRVPTIRPYGAVRTFSGVGLRSATMHSACAGCAAPNSAKPRKAKIILRMGAIIGPKWLTPAAHGLIGNRDSALGQQILDVAEAQGEPDIKPDRLLDDLGREAVAATVDLGHHRWLRLKVTDGKPNGDVTMP